MSTPARFDSLRSLNERESPLNERESPLVERSRAAAETKRPTDRVVAAVDLGATSGRVMLGYVGDDELRLEQVARFPNGPVAGPDGLHWDFTALYGHIVDGLREAFAREPQIASIGIDSWAVDYGLITDGCLVAEPFHYRDERCLTGVERVHATVPFAELYRRNGLQFLPFNTLYQYAVDAAVATADATLLIPDLVAYLLTGTRVAERTNASTTGLLDVHTREWDEALVAELGIPSSALPALVDPGTSLGPVTGEAAAAIGAAVEVIAVGSHDTASAVVAAPLSTPDSAEGAMSAYISCGTWGLVGVELDEPLVSDAAREAGFTNEGGVDGRTRFLHNVTGLWLLSETVRAWEAEDGAPIDLPALLDEAATLDAAAVAALPLFDANDERLSAPGDMPARIASVLQNAGADAPPTRAALTRCIVESIAQAFADALATVASLTGRALDAVHLIGGGSLNRVLCQATADRSGLPVLAGPVEATALGNVLVQARAHGWLGAHATSEDLRALVAATHPPQRYTPRRR